MKREIDSIRRLEDWYLDPTPAIFQGMDLTSYTDRFEGISLSESVFLDCEIDKSLAINAAAAGCYLIPPTPRTEAVPFNPFVRELYTPEQLFDTLDSGVGGKPKKVYPVLEKRASEKGFADYLLISEDPNAVKFIGDHPPA